MTEENKGNSEEENNKGVMSKFNEIKTRILSLAVLLSIVLFVLFVWFNAGQVLIGYFCEVELLCTEDNTKYLTVHLSERPNWLGLFVIGYLAVKFFVFIVEVDQPSDLSILISKLSCLQMDLEEIRDKSADMEKNTFRIHRWLNNAASSAFPENKIFLLDELRDVKAELDEIEDLKARIASMQKHSDSEES